MSESVKSNDNVIDPDSPDYSQEGMSRVFKMSSGSFAKELLFEYAWIWLLGLSLIAVGGLVLGFVIDFRWILIGFMIICLVIPMALAFLYYYYGFRRECVVNTIDHRVIVAEDGLICRLRIPVDNDDNEIRYRWRDEFFPFASMKKFVIGNNAAIIPLKSPSKGFLWLPSDSFNEEEHLSALLRLLDKKTSSDPCIITDDKENPSRS